MPSTLVNFYVVPTHAPSTKDTSVAAHCHAAPARLTREYQGDHRRYVLTPTKICAAHALDTPFHIRSSAEIVHAGRSRRPKFV
jgi:hypothetical protein